MVMVAVMVVMVMVMVVMMVGGVRLRGDGSQSERASQS